MNAVRVIKVGGSLLEFPDLAQTLRQWLELQAPAPTVLIAGGGKFADVIRDADVRFRLGEEAAHWLCIDALGVTARLVARLLPEAELECGELVCLSERLNLAALGNGIPPLIVFDLQKFLRNEEPSRPHPIPHAWSVTSDSLAARLAEVLAANELVLLKSASGTSHGSPNAASEAGFVDAHFPRASERLPFVRCVNLRDPSFEEVRW